MLYGLPTRSLQGQANVRIRPGWGSGPFNLYLIVQFPLCAQTGMVLRVLGLLSQRAELSTVCPSFYLLTGHFWVRAKEQLC